MKSMLFSTIKLIVSHLMMVLIGTVAGAILYMIYSMCSTLVAGQGFAAFNLAFFIQGFFLSIPFVFAISTAFASFYLIRYKEIPLVSAVIFAVIYMAMWIFIQPVVIRAGIQKASKSSYVINREPLSTGYFRNAGDGFVFYYSSVDRDNIASGICIDKNSAGQKVYTFKDVELSKDFSTFTDSLIQTSIEIPPVTRFAIKVISAYLGMVTLECSSGFTSWLLFSSLGLALITLIFMKGFSRWKLINVVVIFSLALTVIGVNVNMLSFGKLYFATQRISSLFTFAPEQSNFLLFIINILLAAAFSGFGIVLTSINRNKNYGVDYGDNLQ